MATKKHKKRKRDTRSEEQKAQSARDLAQQATAQPQTQKKTVLSRSKDKAPEKAKSTKAVAKSDPNKKPSLWRRFVNYCKEVKGEVQRVVWPRAPSSSMQASSSSAPSCSSASASPSSITSSSFRLMPSQPGVSANG